MMPATFVATVGDRLAARDQLRLALESGVTAFRLNLGRRTVEQQVAVAAAIRELSSKAHIFVDLPGVGKARVSAAGDVRVPGGGSFTLVANGERPAGSDRSARIPVQPNGFLARLRPGGRLKIGKTESLVETVDHGGATCRPVDDVTIRFGDSVRWLSACTGFPELDPRDVGLVQHVRRMQPDYVALSFCESSQAIEHLRSLLDGTAVRVLAKIETVRGLVNATHLAAAADGIMLGRDDLSYRLGAAGMAEATEELARVTRANDKEYVAASCYFASMVKNATLTDEDCRTVRTAAEISDWLVSDETAFTDRPFEIVKAARRLGLLGNA